MKRALTALWRFLNYPIIAVVLAIYLFPYLLMLPRPGASQTTAEYRGDAYTHYSYYGGERYVTAVPLARLADTPSWSPDTEHPPLSPGRAVEIARAALAQLVPNAQEWRRQTLTLSTPGHINKYYYLVQFAAPPHHNSPHTTSGTIEIAVLMDGQAIQAVTEGA